MSEAVTIKTMVSALRMDGIKPSKISILTPFQDQVSTLHTVLATEAEGVAVMTVDKSQGHENECVIVSLVLTGGCWDGQKGLGDARRLNVMLTRATSKLVIVGSRESARSGRLAALFAFMDERGWVVNGNVDVPNSS